MPDDERLHDLTYRFMALGLIFDTLMLITGAIWAQDAWGAYDIHRIPARFRRRLLGGDGAGSVLGGPQRAGAS
jgi:hypothetical protein